MTRTIVIPKSLVGLTETKATKTARDAGYACRVLRRDQMVVVTVTQEIDANRVNLEIDANRVTKAWIG